MSPPSLLTVADAARVRQRRLELASALGLAGASGVLAFLGMQFRYAPGDETLLPGMNAWPGQVAWAVLLTTLMVLIAWWVRGISGKRLQWAVASSLFLHLLLCVCLQVLPLAFPVTAQIEPAEVPGRPLEELTLPDHGGMEAPEVEAVWERPTQTPAREREIELQRQSMQANAPSQPRTVESSRQAEITKAELKPQEQPVELTRESAQPLERQMQELPRPTESVAAQPAVTPATAAAATANPRATQSRQRTELSLRERETEALAAATPRVAPSNLRPQRTETQPQAAPSSQVELQNRMAAAAAAAQPLASAEFPRAQSSAAAQPTLQDSSTAPIQQQSIARPVERVAANSPTSLAESSLSTVRPTRVAAAAPAADSAPTGGGSVSLTRSTPSASASSGASAAAAESVAVASASRSNESQLAESSASSTTTRSRTGTLPTSSGSGSSSSAVATSREVQVNGAGSLSRQSGNSAGPQMGAATALFPAAGGAAGTGRAVAAVGTQASEVAVSGSGGGASAGAQGTTGLIGEPGGATLGRRTSAVPGSSGGMAAGTSGPTGAAIGSTTGTGSLPNRSVATAARGSGSSGLGTTTTEPSARLGTESGSTSGSGSALTSSRPGAMVGLPGDLSAAEQAGQLVLAGPQSSATASGMLAGPSRNTVPRRSAGLPGSSGPAASALPSGGAGAMPAATSAGQLARANGSNSGPRLAEAGQIAGLIKTAIPGVGLSPEAKVSASFSMRQSEARRDATRSLGGTVASEEAVERGLRWLANHQQPDGSWSIHQFPCDDHECDGHGSFHANSAATGLALLAFLGAGYTHQTGQHQVVVDRGLKWLLSRQKPDGDLFADETEFVWFYGHGMASIALCEAYGLTKDPTLKGPAQASLDFIVRSQHPEFGGWRYRPRFESDTSVSGWQLMALKSGEISGLTVPASAYAGVSRWLDTVESQRSPGQFAYHPSKPASLAMTAEGLLMRQYLGVGRDDTRLVAGAEYLKQHLPDQNQWDAYFWYYGTQVMFHMQGEYWDEWNSRLRDTLVSTQLKEGGSAGSWHPTRPTAEKWSSAGGRHYVTCMHLLMLEVYYRHLPLYLELSK